MDPGFREIDAASLPSSRFAERKGRQNHVVENETGHLTRITRWRMSSSAKPPAGVICKSRHRPPRKTDFLVNRKVIRRKQRNSRKRGYGCISPCHSLQPILYPHDPHSTPFTKGS